MPLLMCSDCGVSLSADYITRLQKLFCSPCWENYCNFRFRKRLYELGKPPKGSSAAFRNSDGILISPRKELLIIYDGSESSKALLYLTRQAAISSFDESILNNSHDEHLGRLPFPFNLNILFIMSGLDESYKAVDIDYFQKDINFLLFWLKETENMFSLVVPIYITTLHASNKEELKALNWQDLSRDENIIYDRDKNNELSSILKSRRSKTSQIDLIRILNFRKIKYIGTNIGISKVIIPEDQTDMAINMFSLMSTGRGSQLADQMNFISLSQNGIELSRPLMDLSKNDLKDYLNLIKQIDVTNKQSKIDNLRSQCENFIVSLQKDFPSTVPTLTKIGVKLKSTSSAAKSLELVKSGFCKLCETTCETLTSDVSLCYGCLSITSDTANKSIDPLLASLFIN